MNLSAQLEELIEAQNETLIKSRDSRSSNSSLEPRFGKMVGDIPSAVGDLPCFKDLIAVLFECLLIISLGYLSGRFNLISTQAKDLNSYLTTFALPMIIFLNIAQMEFHTINLSFLICILTAKLFVFIIVTLLTITISYPRNFGYAGALSILATQSNDFALGYPLIKSLYGETKPEMLSYLSLMAPIQLLILNPLGIAMLEYNKSKNSKSRSDKQCDSKTPCGHPPTSPSRPRNHQLYPNTRTSQVIPHERAPSQKQPRLRKQGNLLTKASYTTRVEDTDRLPVGGNVIVIDNLQKPASSGDQIRTMAGVDQLVRGPNRDMSPRLKGFKHRNIKSLSLIIPSSDPDIPGSEESIHSLSELSSESKFLDHGLVQQTRAKYNPATVDCQLVQPIIEQQNFVNQQHLPTTELNVHLPALATNCSVDVTGPDQSPSKNIVKRGSAINLNFLKALATNPLIIASVVALLVNLVHGPELPKFVTRVSNTIAASFASPALFVVGLSMYGKFELFRRNPSELLLSSVLVLTKVLILPNLMRTLALMILPKYTSVEELSCLVDFSFLYGLLPTAPTACIIANQYGVLSNVVSISMLLSTFISTPLMISSAFIISPATVIKVNVVENILSQTMQVSSVMTLTLALLTLYAFWKSKNNRNYTNFMNIAEFARGSINKITAKPLHAFLLLLAVSQAMIGMGGLIWYFVDTGELEPVFDIDPIPDSIAAFKDNITRSDFDDNMIRSTGEEATNTLPMTHEHLSIPRHVDLEFKILITAQHVCSSYGLMMARFVVVCLLSTIFAIKFGGEVAVKRVADFMLKAYFLLAATLLIWLVFDSDLLKRHLPVEASLPDHTGSLWIRLVYDIIILSISIPLFAIIIRSYNEDMTASSKDDKMLETDEVGSSLVKRRFVTSSASLSSDTSSALTSNTNLESASNASQSVQMSQELNNNHNVQSNDTMSVVLESDHYETMKRSVSPEDDQSVGPLASISNSIANSVLSTEDPRIGNTSDIIQNRQYELNDPTNNRHATAATRYKNKLTISEFNKYSLLIVFILINSTHNLTSIAQKLLQNQPFGTFRQIEVTNAALEFGQGLLTFLIYGMRGFSR